ncbi:hypothetical protein VTN77DRAFT_3904 [Rasamsonia byssochlamydoides]|uniref:uncharacterized protein n=1 Tax=Rasamsonia byssochlamydoides TaxID=89139 RepID=UPI0037420A4A
MAACVKAVLSNLILSCEDTILKLLKMVLKSSSRQPMLASDYGRIHASTAQLFSLTTALILLQILRTIVCCLRIVRLPGPKTLESCIDRTERRILRILPYLMEWNVNEPRKSTLSSGDGHMTIPRADRSSEHSPFDEPLDAVIVPTASSQPSTAPSREISNRETRQRYHFQASQPRYQGNMSLTKSAVVLPTYMSPRAVNLSANLDGAAVILPPVPTYLSRMSYKSVSDSIYSSTSNGPVGRRQMSTSSSLKGVAPVAAHVYTDLLPKRPIFSSTSRPSSRQYSIHDKIRSSSNVRSELTSLAETMDQFPSLAGTISSFPGNFPVSDDLEYSSLATVSQHVDSGHSKMRPLSAPMFRFGSVESGNGTTHEDEDLVN